MPRVVPRKTAWSTRQEFRLVFDRLFASEGDIALQQDAIGRIQVWLNRGQCPHAVESTAALLQLILRDAQPSTSTAAQTVSEHELRLSYSMAIIRFVNSLVDPLQTTYYARSIASLAAQISLPAWFVELRHQATHEDLPSIAVLRDAARQALDWLYAHYWLPALESSSSATSTLDAALPPLPLETLRPLLLTTYKSLSKQITRDASLAGKLKADVQKTYKEIERWIADNSLGGGIRGGKKEEEARERALEAVAEILWEEGGLVPLAKKKRPSTRSPGLPIELRALWSPLLAHFDNLYDGALSETITRRGIDMLCTGVTNTTSEETAMDRTYAACVVAWVAELLKDAPLGAVDVDGEKASNGFGTLVQEDGDEEEDGEEAKELTIKNVLRTCLLSRSLHVIPLIETLLAAITPEDSATSPNSESTSSLSERMKPLLPLLRAQALAASSSTTSVTHDTSVDFVRRVESAEEAGRVVQEMEQRSDEVTARLVMTTTTRRSAVATQQAGGGEDAEMRADNDEEEAAESNTQEKRERDIGQPVQLWTKRPIGALPKGGVLALDLPPWNPEEAQMQPQVQV
ncbi:hypothetical protein JCM10908_007080 [Rhodotorula pacifica]|uniref:rRNA-processing protein LAS1 n=1 Tax=Rhodotorula pacifica TaxID=1495444 RepID=UPI00317AEFC1